MSLKVVSSATETGGEAQESTLKTIPLKRQFFFFFFGTDSRQEFELKKSEKNL